MESLNYLPLKAEMDAAIQKACNANGMPSLAQEIEIFWSHRLTRTAGWARAGIKTITLSVPLLQRCDMAEQIETVVHEACHIITYYRDDYRRGHGMPWKRAMARAGYRNARRCHSINRDGLKRESPYRFRCNCRPNFALGPTIGARIAIKNRIYRCKLCLARIQTIGQ